jgi:hypothetical protein
MTSPKLQSGKLAEREPRGIQLVLIIKEIKTLQVII